MLTHVKDQVELVLKNHPQTRNNDKLLQVMVLKIFYGVTYISDILKPNVPSLESIRRCRQKIQAEGRYTAIQEVKKARSDMVEVYREFAKKDTV